MEMNADRIVLNDVSIREKGTGVELTRFKTTHLRNEDIKISARRHTSNPNIYLVVTGITESDNHILKGVLE